VLPQLRKIEERFPNEVVVIGVHYPKFPAEHETYNVRAAVQRHDVRHPVVNDREGLLWRAYAARAWPTLVIIAPDGRIVGAHAGEFDGEALAGLLGEIIAQYDQRGEIDRRPISLAPERRRQVETLLSFPGKVLADRTGKRLFVADTDHHRILAFGLDDGRLKAVYGGSERGFRDGADRGRLDSPQGMALKGDALYAADTGNHAVRRIALDTRVITTVAGTGEQAAPWPAPGPARNSALNSPWDVLAVGDTLYVAMAGSHQIWTIDLVSGALDLFAGDGREALHDGPRLEARLAQPSGLATDGRQLWFTDSETSSIRSVALPPAPRPGRPETRDPTRETVKTHVGQGLFEFGDVDGSRDAARLQHPLDVACADGLVYAADAYNNKIKVLNPSGGEIRTLSGTGEPGLQDGPAEESCFWEPGGLDVAGGLLYLADTNNHAVRAVDRKTGETWTVDLRE
jgi:sugar lactone lactonase YvrE